jgi:hypothetical protein
LPAQTSTFIGREAELRAVRALLDAAEVRLVTLVGPGGSGKTRLAIRCAADVEVPDRRAAAAKYEQAVSIAGRRGARAGQLQALTRLARLRRGTSAEADALGVLRVLYDGLTEGRDLRRRGGGRDHHACRPHRSRA